MPHSPLKAGNIDTNSANFSPYLTPKIVDRDFNLVTDTSKFDEFKQNMLNISNNSNNMQHVVTMQNGLYNNNEQLYVTQNTADK